VRAKALFAIDIEAEMPELSRHAEINLINARHPLLLLSFKKEKHTVVPLNIKIDEVDRIIVVSGPNAGGKSVCMKTVGVLQVMVQAGLLIPVDEHSKTGVFKQVFADIGDDQIDPCIPCDAQRGLGAGGFQDFGKPQRLPWDHAA
jgi:DNA mismatch repair protein MutS2